jgi:hypothetical protein
MNLTSAWPAGDSETSAWVREFRVIGIEDGAERWLRTLGRTYDRADALIARAVPLVFATGYGASVIPERYGNVPVLQKLFDPVALATALFPNAVAKPCSPDAA